MSDAGEATPYTTRHYYDDNYSQSILSFFLSFFTTIIISRLLACRQRLSFAFSDLLFAF